MFNGDKRGHGNERQKSKDFGAAIKRLFKELKGLKILVILGIVFAVGGSVLTIIAPNRISDLTDEIANGLFAATGIDLNAIWAIAIFMIILYASAALLELAEGLIMTQVSNAFAKDLRRRITQKINRLPLSYFDRNQIGDILSRVTNDVDTVAMSLSNSLSTLISETALMLGVIVMMFITNWTMAIVAVIASVIGFIGMGAVLKKSQHYFNMRQTELGKLNAKIEEVYSGLDVMKAYNGEAESNSCPA